MRAIEGTLCAMLLSCAASAPATKPPETVTEPPATTTTVNVTDAGAPIAFAAAEAGTPAPSDVLPPAKPTTIPLTTTNDTPEARELRAGDEAFEKGDWAGAQQHYEAAKKAAPTHVAAKVGIARARIAKTGAALDYGAAKGNAEVTA